ncbi:hypothetical protein [uncultured Bacteroides sp.]|uniref:hypothetical protein n=1 Tax=uncultured Bacteroides sp. TaxID=162156 RepID=UPI002634C03A|nr:hypothetical protein [uncultured Bacteroides sp.]
MERGLQFALTSVAVIWFLFKKGNNNMTVKELIKELEACEPDAVVSIVINEINLEVTEIIAPAPEIVELS